MKIGIVVACLGRKHAGPETYERQLIANIGKLPTQHEFSVYCFSKAAAEAVPRQNGNIRTVTLWPSFRPLSLACTLPWMLGRHGVGLYHATFVPAPFSRTRSVFTMHDTSPFTHPQLYPAAIRMRLLPLIRRGLTNGKLIICISENCRETTQEYFGIESDRLTVIPHGVDDSFRPMDKASARARVKERFGIEEPFILYLGKLEARKNILRLLKAYHQLRAETGHRLKLVLAGPRFWDLHDIDGTIRELGIGSDVLELGYVPQDMLVPLYAACEVFVFPSLWEGFGFPVVEAMKCGAPVVASRISSLAEVGGRAAEFVDPNSVESIAGAMAKVLSDASHREKMIAEGFVQAGRFTWENTAQKTLAAYERALAL